MPGDPVSEVGERHDELDAGHGATGAQGRALASSLGADDNEDRARRGQHDLSFRQAYSAFAVQAFMELPSGIAVEIRVSVATMLGRLASA